MYKKLGYNKESLGHVIIYLMNFSLKKTLMIQQNLQNIMN